MKTTNKITTFLKTHIDDVQRIAILSLCLLAFLVNSKYSMPILSIGMALVFLSLIFNPNQYSAKKRPIYIIISIVILFLAWLKYYYNLSSIFDFKGF